MAFSDQLMGYGGAGQVRFLDFAYSGSYEQYYDVYGGKLYMELMLLTSGTLLIPSNQSYVCDIWGVGGGGGSDGSAGGGSGYTSMLSNVTLAGNISVTIGQGGVGNTRGGSTLVGGTAFAAEGGHPGMDGDGGNGGSGGGATGQRGGVNGGSGGDTGGVYFGGSGDGLAMARFYDETKAHNHATFAQNHSSTGGAGYGDWLTTLYREATGLLRRSGGLGTGASEGTAVGAGASYEYSIGATAGVCFLRFEL